jgi:hypothetical protein
MIDLMKQYPSLLIILVIVIAIVIIIAVVNLFRGSEFSTPILKFGKKSDNQQNIQRTVIQNVVNANSLSLSEEQLDMMVNHVVQGVKDSKSDVNINSHEPLYKPQKLPEGIEFIFTSRYSIERMIRGMVLKYAGGWAGCSIAPFENYLDLAVNNKIIPEELKKEINDYYYVTEMTLNIGDLPAHRFLEIKYLAANIDFQLNSYNDSIVPIVNNVSGS